MLRKMPLEQRLGCFADRPDDCWDWPGGTSNGYGQTTQIINGRKVHATVHRMAYEILVGPIPHGLQLDHLCRNRRCMNPRHLELVTPRENTIRGNRGGVALAHRQATHCKRGHPKTPENTYLRPGRRQPECYPCIIERKREWRNRRYLQRYRQRA